MLKRLYGRFMLWLIRPALDADLVARYPAVDRPDPHVGIPLPLITPASRQFQPRSNAVNVNVNWTQGRSADEIMAELAALTNKSGLAQALGEVIQSGRRTI